MHLDHRDLRRDWLALCALGPRPAGSEALSQAERLCRSHLMDAGWSVRDEAVPWRGGDGVNLVAERAGDGSWIIVLAHLDTVPQCTGANDNATGVAMLLELARRWRDRPLPGPGLRLIVTAHEEIGHAHPDATGAAVHRAGCRRRGERIRAALALDTLGCLDPRWGVQLAPRWWLRPWFGWRGDWIGLVGTSRASALARDLARAAGGTVAMRPLILPTSLPWTLAGDHAPFARDGVPALRICDTDRQRFPHYHRSGDVPSSIGDAWLALADPIDRMVAAALRHEPQRGA